MIKRKIDRGEIVKILKQRKEISGEEIAQLLGISRTAVWKHIKTLIKKGYPIRVSKKGYGLLEKANYLFEEEFTEFPLKVYYFKEITSTMDVARKIAEKGEEALVLAEIQTSGRGRLNRSWISPSGGIWMSLILKPHLDLTSSSILTYVAGLATALSIEENTGIKVNLKWPNDVLFEEKKLAGLLLEVQGEPDKVKYVIIGIGINVNNLISHIEKGAISIREILNQEVDRKKIVITLVQHLKNLLSLNREKILSMWKEKSSTLNREVRVITFDREIIGRALDIAEDGALILKTEEGIQKVYSGDCIHLRASV
ncbi:MAG: biotin--[acetyl-CoA-carboxylase] ligase [Thermodesulfobacterium sp.]|nr:biotin--[acetyl-CoA-carboxylase] ligase [Thermodesulfobacterium sp.]